jgi:hypothetical protein
MALEQVALQVAATAIGNGVIANVGGKARYTTVYVWGGPNGSGVTTITGGTVVVEEMADKDYAGTWVAIQTITASASLNNAAVVVRVAGSVQFVRARISGTITGGGVVNAVALGQ